ncbi:hypothetical protein JVU11DRAFT_2281 [Chiua virens]|nr:hypothetical protein JVU11DRAFT_2281 [Chiua virens]
MHSALQLDEILLNIFSHCNQRRILLIPYGRDGRRSDRFSIADFAALARTCRALKELALDLLWSELADLTHLAGCLSKACYEIIQGQKKQGDLSFLGVVDHPRLPCDRSGIPSTDRSSKTSGTTSKATPGVSAL